MPLDKTSYKNGVEALLTDLYNNGGGLSTAQARTAFANGMADLAEALIKSGDGKLQAGTLKAGATIVTDTVGGNTSIKIT